MAQNTIINDKIDYNAIFCRAVDTIVKNRLSELSFDNTVTAEIIDASNAAFGYYIVREKDLTYEAMSDNHQYKAGDKVYVTIPSGDYNNTKVILSAYKDGEELAALAPVRPKDIKVLRTIKELANVDILQLVANSETNSVLPPNLQPITTSEVLSIELTSSDIEYLKMCDSLILSVDVKCPLRASYRHIFSGRYGLRVILTGADETVELGRLDFNNFMGDPYAYLSYFNQYVVLNVGALKDLDIDGAYTLEITSFQNNAFQYKDEENHIHYVAIPQASDNYIETASALLPQATRYFNSLYNNIPALSADLSSNILFRNLKLNIGFNATGKNKTFHLRNNESNILPIWYNYDETTGQEIGYSDGVELDYENFYYRSPSIPFHLYWGNADFRQLSNSNKDSWNEHLYSLHLRELQSCKTVAPMAKKDFSRLDVNGRLNTKEFLTIYNAHIRLRSESVDFVKAGINYFDTLKRNSLAKMLKNTAEPEIISNVGINNYGAECVINMNSFIELNNNNGFYPVRFEVNVQSKTTSDYYEDSNLIYLSIKYPKNIGLSFRGDLGLNVNYTSDADLAVINPQQLTQKHLYYKVYSYSDLYDAIGIIYYNPNGIFNQETLLDNTNRKQTLTITGSWNVLQPFITDKLPCSLLGLSYPEAPNNFTKYSGDMSADKLVTYIMNKAGPQIISYSTAFKSDFNLFAGNNEIDNYLEMLLSPNCSNTISSLIPIGKDFVELYKALQELINMYITDSKVYDLLTEAPWSIDSKNYLQQLLQDATSIIPIDSQCEWHSDDNQSWALNNWSAIEEKYQEKIIEIYNALMLYMQQLWNLNPNQLVFISYLPASGAIEELRVFIHQLATQWSTINEKRSNLIKRVGYCMPLNDYGYNPAEIGEHFCSVYDWRELCALIGTFNANDFEFEFAKFLSFFKDSYNICVYEYNANRVNENPFILTKEWHLNTSLSKIFNNYLLNNSNVLTIANTTAIRAILFFNHQPFRSNIIYTNAELNEETVNVPIYDPITDELIGNIHLEHLLDLISKYKI